MLEHETIAPSVLERIEEAKKEGNSQAHSRLQPYLNRLGDKLNTVDKQLPAFSNGWSTIVEQAEAGNLDSKTLRQFSTDPANRDMFEALSGIHQDLGKESGVTDFVKEIGRVLNSQAFLDNFHPRARQMVRDANDRNQTGNMDPALYQDFVTEIGSEVAKPLKAEIKELKAEVQKLEGEKRDIVRTNGKPPADVGAATGGGASGQPRNDQEATDWHATGKWTTKQMREYRGRR